MESAQHHHYDHYDADQIHRLDGPFGVVDDAFNSRVADRVVGNTVLDFGCGFGSLVDHLRRRGFDATGVDLLESQVWAGRDRFPDADIRLGTPRSLPFADRTFDTVVFKESLHHLVAESDVQSELADVARVCTRRVIVFEPNPSIPLRIGRTLIGHVDPMLPPSGARALLEDAGFAVSSVAYLAALVFPLSGGYVGRPLLSRSASARLLRFDDRIVRLLGSRVAWRYLMVADKVTA